MKPVTVKTPVCDYFTTDALAKELAAFLEGKRLSYTGAIGGQFTWSFSPTSLGLILVVTCGCSGEKFDATPYEIW